MAECRVYERNSVVGRQQAGETDTQQKQRGNKAWPEQVLGEVHPGARVYLCAGKYICSKKDVACKTRKRKMGAG